jgi:hypothetical protein
MSTSSRAVHDATVALLDAANAASVLNRVATALSETLAGLVDLEARIEALEHAIVYFESVETKEGREGIDLQSTAWEDTRSHVDTSTAARLLNRTPQTLRKWACYEDGPLRPARVNGRLAWAVADIRRLLSNVKSRD